ncbi:MAG: DUF1697 domain-containing protein [Flavobacteriales bacterium]|nr:DUF1697 domain-containing protein [Flavobacteriales bacterium]
MEHMNTYIAILRGINVSGARPLPMKELKALFEGLKCGNIRTYIQSGNVVFEGGKIDPLAFASKVEAAIKKKYDYDVPVLMRTLDEMKAVVQDNPYLKHKGIELDKLHVTFLAEAPGPAEAEKIAGTTFTNDSFALHGREVCVHCPTDTATPKLQQQLVRVI